MQYFLIAFLAIPIDVAFLISGGELFHNLAVLMLKLSLPAFVLAESSKQKQAQVRAAIPNDDAYEMGRYKWNVLHCTQNKLIKPQNDQWRLLKKETKKTEKKKEKGKKLSKTPKSIRKKKKEEVSCKLKERKKASWAQLQFAKTLGSFLFCY